MQEQLEVNEITYLLKTQSPVTFHGKGCKEVKNLYKLGQLL